MTKIEKQIALDTCNNYDRVLNEYQKLNKSYETIDTVIKNLRQRVSPWINDYCKKEHITQDYFIHILAQNIWNLHLEKK